MQVLWQKAFITEMAKQQGTLKPEPEADGDVEKVTTKSSLL